MRTTVTYADLRVLRLALLGTLVAAAALVGMTGGGQDTTLLTLTLLGATLIWTGAGSTAFARLRGGTSPRTALRSRGCSGHVEAPTAYWCAVPVPARPRLPRAPGRG